MAALVGYAGQVNTNRLFDASGAVTVGGTPQLILPIARIRTSLIIENSSSSTMYLEFGGARASATLTSGAVSSVSVTNAGFGYTRPPSVVFYGGAFGPPGNPQSAPAYALPGLPDWTAPSNVATAHCVMTGAAGSMTVNSIVIDNPGSGYAYPPYVLLVNDINDPFGAAVPSATSGIQITGGGAYSVNASICPTDQISVFCSASSATFVCKYTL